MLEAMGGTEAEEDGFQESGVVGAAGMPGADAGQ